MGAGGTIQVPSEFENLSTEHRDQYAEKFQALVNTGNSPDDALASLLERHTVPPPIQLVAFSPGEFRSFPIAKIIQLSFNTKIFEISLPSNEHEMGAHTASLVMIQGRDGEDVVARPYTPVSLNDQKGCFEVVIKAYPGGIVSSYLHSLQVGDCVKVKGPFQKLKYSPNMKKSIGMICGGTGITPMLQVIKEIIQNSKDTTQVHLLFANKTEEDILFKSTLDTIQEQHSNIKVTYVVTTPSSSWQGLSGHVNGAIIASCMAPPSEDSMVFVCGPPGMMKAVSGDKLPDKSQGPLEGYLKVAGYTGGFDITR